MEKVSVGTQVKVASTGNRGEVVEVFDGGWTGWALVLQASDSDPYAVPVVGLQPWDGRD